MKIKNLALSFSAMALAAAPLSAQAAENLASDDFVGISFWLISYGADGVNGVLLVGNTIRRR